MPWLALRFFSDALEQALAHILRHGYDIDHAEELLANAQYIKDKILVWDRHTQEDVPGYVTWEEAYEFTFNALHKLDAIPAEDTTPIDMERNLWSQYFDDDMKRQYCVEDSTVERAKLDDHAGSLASTQLRLAILDSFRNLCE